MGSDPTNTITLRRVFAAQMKSRFVAIDKLMNVSIVKNDCFGLRQDIALTARVPKPPTTWKDELKPIGYKRFEFNTNPEKIKLFLGWLAEMEDKSIFQRVNYPRVGPGINQIWTNLYIASAYKTGIMWSRHKMKLVPNLFKALDIRREDVATDGVSINEAFDMPIHADRVGVLYTRTFTDLKGVTDAMDTQISRVLSAGLIQGSSAVDIARLISEKVQTIGIHRATLIARTEVIRAHHLASIQEYRNAGILGVEVEAEWHTARDDRVCSLCVTLDYAVTGKVWSLDAIEGRIPVHPQCRCAALPHLPDI